jgi:hypothetical protein
MQRWLSTIIEFPLGVLGALGGSISASPNPADWESKEETGQRKTKLNRQERQERQANAKRWLWIQSFLNSPLASLAALAV